MEKFGQIKGILSKYVTISIILIFGFFLGWLVFHPSQNTIDTHDHSEEVAQSTIWTCSMHPQIRMEEPGDCPICGMDLIPLVRSGSNSIDPDAVLLSNEAAQLANVQTSVVGKQQPLKEVRLYGKVQADERLVQNQVSHIPGRIESLSINFTGESVKVGQVMAQIYSPELITAQQELLEAAGTKQSQPEIYEAAKEKLRQWKLTENQISAIEESGSTQSTVDVLSNTSGIVTSRMVNTGDYVSQGTVLFEVANLSKVWVLFDAYESDLQFLKKSGKVTFTLRAFPGTDFSGTIVFIDPVIDPVTRVAKVRVEVGNNSGRLKPGMFASGIVSALLNDYQGSVVIPKSAVLWTGKRSVVYVKQDTEEPSFLMREIVLGPMLGESYVVTEGLNEGEEIVTMGTFSVDAAAQLEGKPSMMNPGGEKTSSMPGMNMSDDANAAVPPKVNAPMDFIMQLNVVYEKYILLKNEFVNSDVKAAKDAAIAVQQALSKVDMKLLSGDSHKQWMDISAILGKEIKYIGSSDQLKESRESFALFSDNLYRAVKTFNLMGKTVYYQYCPMARDDKGAFWLSEIKDIRNPYFGEEMLTCGETRETLKY